MSHYKTLGVVKSATEDDIKAAYRKRALQCHPDKPGGSKELFNKLQLAYDTLRDAKKRTKYNEELAEQRRRKTFKPPPPVDNPRVPERFSLPDGSQYVFETAPDRLRSKFRHGDVVRHTDGEQGVFIGMAGDGMFYWCPSGTSHAVPLNTFGGERDIVIVFRQLAATTNLGTPSKPARSNPGSFHGTPSGNASFGSRPGSFANGASASNNNTTTPNRPRGDDHATRRREAEDERIERQRQRRINTQLAHLASEESARRFTLVRAADRHWATFHADFSRAAARIDSRYRTRSFTRGGVGLGSTASSVSVPSNSQHQPYGGPTEGDEDMGQAEVSIDGSIPTTTTTTEERRAPPTASPPRRGPAAASPARNRNLTPRHATTSGGQQQSPASPPGAASSPPGTAAADSNVGRYTPLVYRSVRPRINTGARQPSSESVSVSTASPSPHRVRSASASAPAAAAARFGSRSTAPRATPTSVHGESPLSPPSRASRLVSPLAKPTTPHFVPPPNLQAERAARATANREDDRSPVDPDATFEGRPPQDGSMSQSFTVYEGSASPLQPPPAARRLDNADEPAAVASPLMPSNASGQGSNSAQQQRRASSSAAGPQRCPLPLHNLERTPSKAPPPPGSSSHHRDPAAAAASPSSAAPLTPGRRATSAASPTTPRLDETARRRAESAAARHATPILTSVRVNNAFLQRRESSGSYCAPILDDALKQEYDAMVAEIAQRTRTPGGAAKRSTTPSAKQTATTPSSKQQAPRLGRRNSNGSDAR